MKVFIVSLLFSITLFAQEVGFTFDMQVAVGPTQGPLALGLSFLGNTEILPGFIIEARAGGQSMSVEYSGWEAGLYSIYYFSNSFFIITGTNYHSNLTSGDWGKMQGTLNNNFILWGAGAGVDINSFISFELLGYLPLKREKISYHHDLYFTKKLYTYLKGVIRADFKFHFDL